MKRLVSAVLVCSLVVPATQGWGLPRTYLRVAGGANVLNTQLDNRVVSERVVGHWELAVGGHLTNTTLLEVSFGVIDKQEDVEVTPIFELEELLLPDTQRAYKVEMNPLMARVRYARSGMRTGYIKPEFSLGLGAYSVSRYLRPFAGIPPEVTSHMLPAAEFGASMLMIMGRNFAGSLGARYTIMQRKGITEDTEHFDGFSFLLSFRFFLNSPADELQPPDEE